MVSAPSGMSRPARRKNHLAVGAVLGWGIYWLLLMVAAWAPQPRPQILQRTLLRIAHWPFLLLHPDSAHEHEGGWMDVAPLAVSIAAWTAIGMIAGLALYLIRTRHENTAEDATGSS